MTERVYTTEEITRLLELSDGIPHGNGSPESDERARHVADASFQLNIHGKAIIRQLLSEVSALEEKVKRGCSQIHSALVLERIASPNESYEDGVTAAQQLFSKLAKREFDIDIQQLIKERQTAEKGTTHD